VFGRERCFIEKLVPNSLIREACYEKLVPSTWVLQGGVTNNGLVHALKQDSSSDQGEFEPIPVTP
jgi:hypothetical protein